MSETNDRNKVSFPDIFQNSFYIWFEDYVKSLSLPIAYTEHFIGAGLIKNMYLFWITKYGSSYIFNCRKYLDKNLNGNRQKILFVEENKDEIINLISHILSERDKFLDGDNIIIKNNEVDNVVEISDNDNNYADITDEPRNSSEDITSLINTKPDNSYYEHYYELKMVTSLLGSLKDYIDGQDVIYNYPDSMSGRLRNCLCRNRYMNFNDLSKANAENLFKMKNFGRKSLEELVIILTKFLSNKVDVKDFIKSNERIAKEPIEEIEDTTKELIYENEKLEFELKITPQILYYEIFSKRLNKEIDEGKIEFYQAIANDYMECINKSCENNLTPRQTDILKKYYFSDGKITLQTIGEEFGVSRERIRQILKKSLKKLLFKFNGTANLKNKGRAIYLFNQIEVDEFINFIKYGFLLNMPSITVKFYLLFIYKEDVVDKILSYCVDAVREKDVKPSKYDNFIDNCVIYPSNVKCNIAAKDIVSVGGLKYSYLINVMKKFKNIPKVTKVIANPNLYYYESSQTKHKPDFALICQDKVILVIVLNTINLGFYYNVLRFNALHQYCSENGFGYIIMNERFKSYQEIKNTEIEQELEDWLLKILEKRKVIEWRDIVILKGKFNINNEKIVAFVSKHKLRFTINPFIIRKRQ